MNETSLFFLPFFNLLNNLCVCVSKRGSEGGGEGYLSISHILLVVFSFYTFRHGRQMYIINTAVWKSLEEV